MTNVIEIDKRAPRTRTLSSFLKNKLSTKAKRHLSLLSGRYSASLWFISQTHRSICTKEIALFILWPLRRIHFSGTFISQTCPVFVVGPYWQIQCSGKPRRVNNNCDKEKTKLKKSIKKRILEETGNTKPELDFRPIYESDCLIEIPAENAPRSTAVNYWTSGVVLQKPLSLLLASRRGDFELQEWARGVGRQSYDGTCGPNSDPEPTCGHRRRRCRVRPASALYKD